jgi:short-subunit dehydrogenase
MAPRPLVLVTGASTGIGAELARLFAADGHQLALVARHEEGLAALAEEIAAAGAPRPLVLAFDLSRGESAGLVAAQLSAKGWEPSIVVNNAGFGLLGPAGALDRAAQLQMIDLNVRTLTDLTLRFLPAVTRHQGGILNVASVAGFLPGPGMAVYYATKAFVLSFSQALAEEMRGSGARVTVLCPGPVPTAFQARSGMSLERMPKFMMLSAEEVARAGYDGFRAGRRVVVPGLANRLATRLVGLAPRRLLLKAVMRLQRRRAPAGRGAARPPAKPTAS